MNRLIRYSFVFLILVNFIGCRQKANDLTNLHNQFLAGNFKDAELIIQHLKTTNLSENQVKEIEITEAKMARIKLDFSKNENQVKNELSKWFPDISAEQLRLWESKNKLEMKLIDGERMYFKNAVANLFRLDAEARNIKENIDGNVVDSLDIFCVSHNSELVNLANEGTDLLEKPQKYSISFTITLDADAVPAGETVKCWMPFPRESLPRQKNVKLLSVNSNDYILAENNAMQRTLYFEKTAESGNPTVFNYKAEFETAAQYFNIQPDQLKSYNKGSEFFKVHTAERKPQIVFSDEIIQLTNKLTSGISNPAEKVKAIFYWIDENTTWASALEYSTIECIPEYVLKNRHGDCGMKTLLFMSMARYAGIPCKWQSGWMLHPGELNLHDWCEVYYEGIGWVPVDQSFGLQKSENQQVKDFYISGIDEFRLIINDDFGSSFNPEKQFYRSEPIDFQRGELEWKGGNIYFNQWDYHLDITYLN
jgi:hypothetical protein